MKTLTVFPAPSWLVHKNYQHITPTGQQLVQSSLYDSDTSADPTGCQFLLQVLHSLFMPLGPPNNKQLLIFEKLTLFHNFGWNVQVTGKLRQVEQNDERNPEMINYFCSRGSQSSYNIANQLANDLNDFVLLDKKSLLYSQIFTVLEMFKMGLPEDLNIMNPKLQDQEIQVFNHGLFPLSFILFYLTTHSNP